LNKLSLISKRKRIALIAGALIPVSVFVILLMPNHRTIELPKSILQLRLTEEIRGKQAQEIVDAMHKKLVTPVENVIGTYFSTDGSAKLYVSLYDSRIIAEGQFERMDDLIRTGGGAFTHLKEIQVQRAKVYTYLGLSQAHFFFLHEKDIYWWAVDLQIAQASMQELIRIVINAKQK
jgi:PHP family Zn ribbon phosphoesterase